MRAIIRFGDKLLIATRGGIQSYDRTRGRQAFSVFDGDSTSALFVDSDGYLWSGTDEGQVKKFVVTGGQVVSTTYAGEATAQNGRQRAKTQSERGLLVHGGPITTPVPALWPTQVAPD